MTQVQKPNTSNRDNAKTLLSTLKLTTTIGAVSLTLAGWGLLSQAEALNAAQATSDAPASFASAAPAGSMLISARPGETVALGGSNLGIEPGSITAAVRASATPTRAAPTATAAATAAGATVKLPTATPTSTSTPAPTATTAATATPAPTDTPEALFKLNVVQWVQTQQGDPVAVVRDNSGTLWYVWGPDVPRIEQGLDPQYQPQPLNATGSTRRS